MRVSHASPRPLLPANLLLVVFTGGSMTIHAFGAYFGLAVSMILSPKGSGSAHPKNRSR